MHSGTGSFFAVQMWVINVTNISVCSRRGNKWFICFTAGDDPLEITFTDEEQQKFWDFLNPEVAAR